MRKLSAVCFAVVALVAFGLAWPPESTTNAPIGKKVENFTLKDYNGKEHSLYDYKGKNAIVIMFIATRCPVSNDYNKRMNELYKDYAAKGVAFIGINSNKIEPVDEVADHAKKNGFQFPVLKDENNVIADRFQAQVTPEIFLLDKNFVLRYHGHIDDSQKEEKVTRRTLRQALDAVLSGKEPPVAETKAFGCTIKRAQVAS